MGNPIDVRRLVPDDATQYRECRLAALLDAPHAFASSYDEEASRTIEELSQRFRVDSIENATFGAFDGERIVGLTGIYREAREKRRHKANIVGVFVRPAYRGQHIGALLMEAAISFGKTMESLEYLELSVEANNEPARALYRSFGFRTWGTEPEFLMVGDKRYDEEYMSLKV